MNVKVMLKKMSDLLPDDKLPCYATIGSAAMDLCAVIEKPLELRPFERALIPTGIAILLPSNEYAAYVFARSGLAVKQGLSLSNGVGLIDSDYTGEIKVGLINLSEKSIIINPLDRIAQLCVVPVCRCEFELCHELAKTDRGSGGFGSTGK